MPLVIQGKNQTSYFIYCWSHDNTVFRDMDFRGSSPVLNDYNNKIIIYVYWVSTTYLAISHIPSSWLIRYMTLDKWLTLHKLSLCFLICKLVIIIVPFSQGYCEHHIWSMQVSTKNSTWHVLFFKCSSLPFTPSSSIIHSTSHPLLSIHLLCAPHSTLFLPAF